MIDDLPHDILTTLEARLAGLQSQLEATGRAVEGHAAWLADLQRWVTSCVRGMALFGSQPLGGTEPGVSGQPDVLGRLLAWVEIQTVMSWIREAALVDDGPLVSVTVATRDRPALLERAVASVLGQSYAHLELIVVDDSDGSSTARLLGQIEDPRLRIVRTPERRGLGAAFNAGLDAVTGELVTFLDDDNLMHRDWLRSIVWAFGQRPGVDALYGARVLEDIGATDGNPSGSFPAFEFLRYDRHRHERANFVDRNTMALRADHATLRYDKQLTAAVDWDYSLRLFAVTPPLALPVIACYYGTLAPGRVSDQAHRLEPVRTVRSRAHEARPLRVHAHCSESDPVALEHDLRGLIDAGAQVTLSARGTFPPLRDVGPWRLDVDNVLAETRADLVLLPSAGDAAHELELLEAHGLPFSFRVAPGESADVDVGLREHRLCLAVLDGPCNLERVLRNGLTEWLYATSPGERASGARSGSAGEVAGL